MTSEDHLDVSDPAFVRVADHALLVEFGTEIDDAAHAAVARLDHAIARSPVGGVVEVIPAFVNLLVDFDPIATDHDEVEAHVRRLLADLPDTDIAAGHHTVPVCYAAPFAPDLPAVARATGLSVDGVIDAHLAGEYRVVMYGFAPGYAYMSGVDPGIQVPRKTTPVRGVAADSVIIAGPQCLITTIEMPTGWSIIGRSATRVLRPEADDPFLFDPGDRVTFERIDLATYDRLRGDR